MISHEEPASVNQATAGPSARMHTGERGAPSTGLIMLLLLRSLRSGALTCVSWCVSGRWGQESAAVRDPASPEHCLTTEPAPAVFLLKLFK